MDMMMMVVMTRLGRRCAQTYRKHGEGEDGGRKLPEQRHFIFSCLGADATSARLGRLSRPA
jgi:hypothetical protein